MVMAHDLRCTCQVRHGRQDSRADGWMLTHLLPFGRVEARWLLQDRIRNTDLADIMQDGTIA